MTNRTQVAGTTIHVGDTVRVHHRLSDEVKGDKEKKKRSQIFEGVVIGIRGKGINKSFTVRRIASHKIGVERIWPVACPSLQKVELKKKGRVRRAKLYYLRKRTGKKATKIREKSIEAKNEKKKPRQSGRKSGSKVSAKK